MDIFRKGHISTNLWLKVRVEKVNQLWEKVALTSWLNQDASRKHLHFRGIIWPRQNIIISNGRGWGTHIVQMIQKARQRQKQLNERSLLFVFLIC